MLAHCSNETQFGKGRGHVDHHGRQIQLVTRDRARFAKATNLACKIRKGSRRKSMGDTCGPMHRYLVVGRGSSRSASWLVEPPVYDLAARHNPFPLEFLLHVDIDP